MTSAPLALIISAVKSNDFLAQMIIHITEPELNMAWLKKCITEKDGVSVSIRGNTQNDMSSFTIVILHIYFPPASYLRHPSGPDD